MRALICGVSGQDGSYLAKFLLEKGYEVWGTSRESKASKFENLNLMGISKDINILSMLPSDSYSVDTVINQCNPDELYYLAGQSSVGLSYDKPIETNESISIGVLNLLESVRLRKNHIKIYHAGSSEVFGNINQPVNEDSPFRPRSPYAVAKASAHWLVANYREAYDLFACNGILFNHESPLRPERFVTRKITSSAFRIAQGSREKLRLGRLDIVRDWGWAPEYVETMWLMLQQNKPDDYIIATGKSHSLEEFVSIAFEKVGLSWRDHVLVDSSLYRPTDNLVSAGNPSKAMDKLGWKAINNMSDVITMMINAEGGLID